MRRLPFALVVAFFFLPSATRAEPLDDKSRVAVDRGLKWLAARWAAAAEGGGDAARAKAAGGGDALSTANASLAGLAFVAAGGADAADGPYAAAYRQCLRRVLADQQEDGLFARTPSHGPMYGHAFATLFLAHALARSPAEGVDAEDRKAIEEALGRGVRLIARAQNAEGGWRYRPEPLDADVSVSSAQLMALRAADRAGVAVDAKVTDRGAAFVASLQNKDGGFRYIGPDGGSGLPRSAAAVAALHASGKLGADEAARAGALGYLARSLDALLAGGEPARRQAEGHVYYRCYYLARALWDAGGEHRAKYWPASRDDLLSRQRPDGSWDGDVNPEYATAMALVALQVPEGRLSLADDARGAGGAGAPADGGAKAPAGSQ